MTGALQVSTKAIDPWTSSIHHHQIFSPTHLSHNNKRQEHLQRKIGNDTQQLTCEAFPSEVPVWACTTTVARLRTPGALHRSAAPVTECIKARKTQITIVIIF